MIKENMFYLDTVLARTSFYLKPISLKSQIVTFEYYMVDRNHSTIKNIEVFKYPRQKWVKVRSNLLFKIMKNSPPLTTQEFETRFHYEPDTRIKGR